MAKVSNRLLFITTGLVFVIMVSLVASNYFIGSDFDEIETLSSNPSDSLFEQSMTVLCYLEMLYYDGKYYNFLTHLNNGPSNSSYEYNQNYNWMINNVLYNDMKKIVITDTDNNNINMIKSTLLGLMNDIKNDGIEKIIRDNINKYKSSPSKFTTPINNQRLIYVYNTLIKSNSNLVKYINSFFTKDANKDFMSSNVFYILQQYGNIYVNLKTLKSYK
jgi:hypothetical protein